MARTILSGGKRKITDGTNTATLNSQGHLNVNQDIQTLPLNRFIASFNGHTTTLSAAVSIGDTSIDIQAADYADFVVGDRLFLIDGSNEENDFPIITVKPESPILILNKPLDRAYSNGSFVQHVILNIFETAGTLSSPVSYKLFPPPGISFYIRGGLGIFRFDGPGDYSSFGDIEGGITNGIVARVSLNGVITTLVTGRTNAAFELDTSRASQFVANAGPGPTGENAFIFTYVLNEWGTYVVLDGDNNSDPLNPRDFFDVLVQDNLTAASTTLTEGSFKIHGYIKINP